MPYTPSTYVKPDDVDNPQNNDAPWYDSSTGYNSANSTIPGGRKQTKSKARKSKARKSKARKSKMNKFRKSRRH